MTELIEKGGFMMYPIMLSSVIALAVFIERLFVFASVKLPKKEISDEFLSSLEKDGVKGGIWEALLTTAAGLAVAIPILFAHNYLERKLDKITHLMMQTAQKTVALMKAGDFK